MPLRAAQSLLARPSVISEDKVDAAVEFLRANAQEAAHARANVRYLEAYLKTLKAQIKGKQVGLSNVAAEDVALCDPAYVAALEGYREAVEKDAYFTFKREAAGAMIEAWRTQAANARIEGKAYG